MSENPLQKLADELQAALQEYRRLETELEGTRLRIGNKAPDMFERRAVGSLLHDVYNGAESICQLIAKQIDRQVPIGESWHRDLLEQMSEPVPKTRLAVLASETVEVLNKYRTFRHVVRNIYGFRLDWALMQPLLDEADEAIHAFVSDIEQFIAFLRMMG
ncbi:MAG TPA: hypothetical protein VI451_16475 [Anaerolineales bacterium]|nr:hypothetical protein [Anaerolineales bacterium]